MIQELYSQISLPVTDPVLIFAIVMALILIVPIVFNRFKLPGEVGLILAGTIVGPSVLGILDRDDTMILLGTVGLLYLMFMAGLSIDLNKFEKLKDRSITFGLFSFFIPQISAIAVGMLLLDFDFFQSLLLGSIVGSHTLLAYPIADKLGIAKNTAITMTMGGTIVTDTLSLLVLAIVSGAVSGDTGFGFWVIFVLMVTLYTVAVIYVLPRLGRWFFKDSKNLTNTEFVFLVALLFLTAYIAELVGLAAIIGAFLAGLSLNRLVPESSPLMSRVQFVGNTLFIPFFLISVGMLVDVGVLLKSPDIWVMSGLFTGLVLFGKSTAAFVSQYIYSYTREEGIAVFGLSTAQAAATLAVTLVGYDLEIFSQDVVNAVVIMILLTCLIGPWLVEKYGREVALQEEKKPYQPSEAPQRILIPLANPATAEALMDISMMIRNKNSEEPLFPLTVARDRGNVEAQVASSEKMLSHAVVHAAAADIPVIPVTRVDMNISNGILRAAKELRISDVVIGWNGEVSAKRRIFGSILDRVLEQSKQLIVVAKITHQVGTAQRIILAVPKHAEREPGFTDAIIEIKTIINELGAELLVFSQSGTLEVVQEFISQKEPELDAEYNNIVNWTEIISKSDITVDEDDLFILLSARDKRISWEPELERLPGIISTRYPENNFLTVYPSEIEMKDQPTLKIHFEGAVELPELDASHIYFGLNKMSAKEVINSMLNDLFGDRPDILDAMVTQVLNIDPDNIPGDIPKVVLTHVRSGLISEPVLLLGISDEGVEYPGMLKPVHVIFILITPRNFSMEKTLRMLARLASLVNDKKVVDELQDIKTVKELLEIFDPADLKI